jgi:lipopolysaccharide transport system ATP-binding protein
MAIEFRNVALAPLDDFTAAAPSGAVIGVVGDKGSGVTELLRVAAGVAQPERGEIRAEPERRFVALGDSLNLAPAAVISLDHALATQDPVVRTRTMAGMERLRRAGSTILLASHEYQLLELLCDEVWWLDKGQLAAKGDPRMTLNSYRRRVAEKVRSWGEDIPPRLVPAFRRGDARGEVLSIVPAGPDGKPTIVWKSGEMVSVRATIRFHEAVNDPVIGLLIRTRIGFEVYGTNTELEGLRLGQRKAGDTVTVGFSFLCDLCPNVYTLTVASHDPDGTAHDWMDDAIAITVVDERHTAGVANLRAKVTLEENGQA